ncbi:MAG: hypothetical protein WCD70_04575 [Alphaproteobacteria bacterium]
MKTYMEQKSESENARDTYLSALVSEAAKSVGSRIISFTQEFAEDIERRIRANAVAAPKPGL